MAIQKTSTNQPKKGRRSSTLAQLRMQERPNIEKVGNTSQGIRANPNMTMGYHTETTTKAPDYEYNTRSNAHVYPYHLETRYVCDGQSERQAKGRQFTPEWQSMNENLQDPHAVNRTTQEGRLVDGYHKGPQGYTYSMDETFQASSGGVRDPNSHRPTHSDGNKVSSLKRR